MEDGALGDGDANCSHFLLWREVEGGVLVTAREARRSFSLAL